MVGLAAKRAAARHLQERYTVSERRVCEVISIDRSSKRRQLGNEKDAQLIQAIRDLSKDYPRFGYRKIWVKLRSAGWVVSRERVRLVRRREGLRLAPKRRVRRRRGESSGVVNQAQYPNHVWTYDFMSDQTSDGRTLRWLTIVDEYTRGGRRVYCGRSITSKVVIHQLEALIALHGAPAYIRSDNGPEFVAQALQKWLEERNIATVYIEPGSPWQNPYGEGFNAIFRDGCLDRWLFTTPAEAQQIGDTWLDEYNNERPHGGLGQLTPAEFERQRHHQLAS